MDRLVSVFNLKSLIVKKFSTFKPKELAFIILTLSNCFIFSLEIFFLTSEKKIGLKSLKKYLIFSGKSLNLPPLS